MKTSKKIIIITLGLLIAYLISSLMIYRKQLPRFVENSEKGTKYYEVPVEAFSRVAIPGGWDVHASQGRDFELKVERGFVDLGKILVRDSTLIFNVFDSTQTSHVKIRIELPHLTQAVISGNGKFRLWSFNQQDLNLELRDSAYYQSMENEFDNVSIETSGNPKIQFDNSFMN